MSCIRYLQFSLKDTRYLKSNVYLSEIIFTLSELSTTYSLSILYTFILQVIQIQI
jgi:hypothetical protein